MEGRSDNVLWMTVALFPRWMAPLLFSQVLLSASHVTVLLVGEFFSYSEVRISISHVEDKASYVSYATESGFNSLLVRFHDDCF